ncbi:MAG: hypothetical protein K2P81_14185 [Bacteriovoracaceae bacterium]|nr:hypothetical protein [Bacteriovoracaceae bacterium]
MIILLSVILNSYAASEIPSLKPLSDHLKTLPAEVRGEIFVKKPLSIKNDDVAKITLKPDHNLYFGFDEKGININFAGAISMCVKTKLDLIDGCKAVEIKNLSWDPQKGFQSRLEVPNWDFFGMIESNTKKELEKTLNERFGAKMKKAQQELKKIRTNKNLSETKAVADALGGIFSEELQNNTGAPIEYGGRVGLVFNEPVPATQTQSRDHGIQLGGVRLGIPYGDQIESSVSFYHDKNGLKLKKLQFRSEKGLNINEGSEFAQNKRIILHNLNLDSNGAETSVLVGASETVMGIIALFQVGAMAMGAPPSQTCQACEIARLPSFTNQADITLREKVYSIVEVHKSVLPSYGVDAETIDFYLKIEKCKINGLKCQQTCFGKDDKDSCMNKCADRYRQCGG